MATEFKNRFKGAACDKCGLTIAVGAPMKWARTNGGKSQKWHKACFEAGDEIAGTAEGVNTATTGATGGAWLEGLADQLAPYLDGKVAQQLDGLEDRIDAVIEDRFDGMVLTKVTTVVIENKTTGEIKDLGLQHQLFPKVMRYIRLKQNVWLTGPAGSGKTTAVENAAQALGLKFYHIGAMDNEYKLKGFIDAQGRIVSTTFREWWLNGGVLCLDEIDSWLPPAALALNGALANGHCDFPDGDLPHHRDCFAVACANTYGLGGTNDYVGRFAQDKAFLDRFPYKIDFPYDEGMETAMCGNAVWAKRVQHLRRKAKLKGLKVIISPRASKAGAIALAAGFDQSEVEEVTIRQGMTQEQWESIQ